ncbi:hypothetical protein BTVI_16550 [Pitangus sulphuratus]|nr:hypothetical protein BTVI_16550 [Pitangus sulphuratus]
MASPMVSRIPVSLLEQDRGIRDGGRTRIVARSSFGQARAWIFALVRSKLPFDGLVVDLHPGVNPSWGSILGIPMGSGVLHSIIPVAAVAMAISGKNKGELELGS